MRCRVSVRTFSITRAPCSSKSAANVAKKFSLCRTREPTRLPAGFPDCPGLNQCAGRCFSTASTVVAVNGLLMVVMPSSYHAAVVATTVSIIVSIIIFIMITSSVERAKMDRYLDMANAVDRVTGVSGKRR
jgi:hypothetical protein